MTKIQSLLITIAGAILFQIGGAFTNLKQEDLIDWKRWAIGLGVGVFNAIGVAIIAWKTTSGLSLNED